MPPRVASTFPPDYALDAGVREQLQLKTFEVLSNYLVLVVSLSNIYGVLQGKFEVKDLVGSVSEKLIAQSKAEPGRAYSVSVHNAKGLMVSNRTAFDPKPFIRTFEAAVDNLIAIRKDVQAKTEKQEKSVQVTEREYSKKMIELNKGFEV